METFDIPKEFKFFCVKLPSGNSIHINVNTKTNLVTVDLVAGNEKGGNEVFRQTLDEKKLLKHCK